MTDAKYMSIRPFARVARADAQPGRCVRCPRNNDLVDLGAPILQGYGVAYLCTVCLGELMERMHVVGAEQHNLIVEAGRQREEALQQQLAAAAAASAAPLEFISRHLERFSDVVDSAARDLVRDLAAGPDRGGDLPAPAADENEPADAGELASGIEGEPHLPVEPAAADPVVPDGVGRDDAGAALLATLGFPDAALAAPASADAGSDDDAGDVGESGDGLDVLYGPPAE